MMKRRGFVTPTSGEVFTDDGIGHRVIPAKAGISVLPPAPKTEVPAFAGMTPWVTASIRISPHERPDYLNSRTAQSPIAPTKIRQYAKMAKPCREM